MAQRVLDLMRYLNKGVAMLIGLILLLCVAFVLTEIVMRQLGTSLGGTDEISGYVMAIVTSWGMGFALLELSHVRIDFLRGLVNAKGRSLFDLFSMFVLSGTITLIAIRCWPVVERSLANSSHANTPLETPLALVQVPWFLGWVWFAIVAWLTLIASVLLILQGEFERSEAAIGTIGEEVELRS
ncbi:TRAP transporter small permease subunit [uncultured Nitratireductor sp.]|uniref:TRAP transporter small permease subunit n=1 Tax=uncultured Nitratireductor sp. TaxID=520953 RepID=UPI0025DE97DD|nr:TRAP transporter small permease subunit [uncultured Nitratireductor sp.]